MTPSAPGRRPTLLTVLTALVTALVLALAGATWGAPPAVAGAERAPAAGSTASPQAGAGAAAGEPLAARPGRPGTQRSCRAVQRRVAQRVRTRVTADRGSRAGARAARKAGRAAYRRCVRRATPTNPTVPTTPTTPPTTPTGPTSPGTPGNPTTPVPPTTTTGPDDPTQPAAPSTVEHADGCLSSVPEPGSTQPVPICFTVVRPAGSSAADPVPMILHSHGWGGSRTTDPADFASWTSAGYGVLSFDQRGFGQSGGQAHVENPALEGEDVKRVVAYVASLPWVALDAPGDPRLGAIGGSYGGGYQFLTAFETRAATGRSAIDAMAPEITWHDLEESLAPSGVVRTAWALALTAAAQPSDAMPAEVVQGIATGLVLGYFPDSLKPFFEKNGPKWQVAHHGGALDVPMLFGQGTTDGLFPLEQGLQNFATAITPAARARSIFVGYNGGHVLPAVLPSGISITSDPCSATLAGGTFADLTLRFFDEQLKGLDTGLEGYGRYHLATPQDTCLDVGSVDATTEVRGLAPLTNVAGPAGAPTVVEVATGPIRLAGTPYLEADVTSLGLDGRMFLGLAAGTSPLDAKPVQNNLLPLRVPQPEQGVRHPRIALPSVAVDLPAGQHLYLLATPLQDTFVGMGSRVPVPMTLSDAVVHLPVVR